MDYNYKILYINKKERWITIKSNDKFDSYEPDSFICLMKRIRDGTNGIIEDIGDTRYRINGNGLKLIYQWDGCFGISIIYPKGSHLDGVIKFLEQYF